MANKARKKRRLVSKKEKSLTQQAGTAKDIQKKRVSMAPLSWSRESKPNCGTYDARRKPMEGATEEVDPIRAHEFLSTSPGNRNISRHTVNRYANDILRDRWALTHQGIAFDTDGHLIDGHNRMHAIIKAGKTVKLFVVRNVPKESVRFLDYGKNRDPKDLLAREGIKSSTKIMHMVKAMVLGYNSSCGGDISNDQYATIAMHHLDDIQWVLDEMGKKWRAPVAGVVLRAVINEGRTEELGRFCNHLRYNTNGGKDCPANALDRYLKRVAAKTASGHQNDLYPRAAAALRAFINGDKLTRLNPASSEYWPFDVFAF